MVLDVHPEMLGNDPIWPFMGFADGLVGSTTKLVDGGFKYLKGGASCCWFDGYFFDRTTEPKSPKMKWMKIKDPTNSWKSGPFEEKNTTRHPQKRKNKLRCLKDHPPVSSLKIRPTNKIFIFCAV